MGLKEDIAKHRKAVYDAKNSEKTEKTEKTDKTDKTDKTEIKESKLALLLKERKEQTKTESTEKETETKSDIPDKKEDKITTVPLSLTEAEFKSMQELITERMAAKKPGAETETESKETDTAKEEATKEEIKETIQETPPVIETKVEATEPTKTEESIEQTNLEKTLSKGRAKLDIQTRPLMSSHPIATVIARECENIKVPEANRDLVAAKAFMTNTDMNSENVGRIVQEVLKEHPNLMRSTSYPSVAGSDSKGVDLDCSNMTLAKRRQIYVEQAVGS